MTDEPEPRFCRVCDRELELIPEEPEDFPTVPLYFCDYCEKWYRFTELKAIYDYENKKTIYPEKDKTLKYL
jgi:hypothetical protein